LANLISYSCCVIGTSEQEIYTLKQQLDNTNKNLKDSTEREVQELRDIYETKLTNQMEENMMSLIISDT
jgi:hypothetical protein